MRIQSIGDSSVAVNNSAHRNRRATYRTRYTSISPRARLRRIIGISSLSSAKISLSTRALQYVDTRENDKCPHESRRLSRGLTQFDPRRNFSECPVERDTRSREFVSSIRLNLRDDDGKRLISEREKRSRHNRADKRLALSRVGSGVRSST